MFSRAFGASDFTRFWQYWNPLGGYFLGYFCYAPLRRFAPRPPCLIVTFALNGFLHDLGLVWPFGFARTECLPFPFPVFTLTLVMIAVIILAAERQRFTLAHLLAHARRLPSARACWPVRLFSRHSPPHTNMTANKSLQATRDGALSSAFAEDVINPACLSSGR